MSRYSLRRTRDGAGDSGMMSMALFYDEGGNNVVSEDNAFPRVGVAMRVGSHYARTFGHDWWQTTIITEILEERETEEGHYVRFKTGNSEYEWESF